TINANLRGSDLAKLRCLLRSEGSMQIRSNQLVCSDMHSGTQPSPTRATSTINVQWSGILFGKHDTLKLARTDLGKA
ncbi:hypothetical protein B0H12DRAFT_1146170, partial [Mycena haematopus]